MIKKALKSGIFKSKIINVDTNQLTRFHRSIKNSYFHTETNKENLSFILEISKYLKLKKELLSKVIENFKGLKYRQQIIFQNQNLKIIND